MSRKTAAFLLILLLSGVVPAAAQESARSNDIMAQMRRQLDLQDDQVYNITPIIDRYDALFADLQKSIDEGTINPSAVTSQHQQLEDMETQEISKYLQPYQLSAWRRMQAEIYASKAGGHDDSQDEYSNLPNNPSSN